MIRAIGWRLLAGLSFVAIGILLGATIANPHP